MKTRNRKLKEITSSTFMPEDSKYSCSTAATESSSRALRRSGVRSVTSLTVVLSAMSASPTPACPPSERE